MPKAENDLLYQLALYLLDGIGPISARNLVSYLGSVANVFAASSRDLRRVPGIASLRSKKISRSDALNKAESILPSLINAQIDCHFYLDDTYPSRLKPFANSPVMVFTKGNLEYNPRRTVGIIGTRSPSEYGQTCCDKIVKGLVKYEATIISGLAYGIDARAHTQAVKHGLPTIAVLGSGIDRIYPPDHKGLASQIVNNGGLLSEFLPGAKPDRENFPMRNRIIAALSDVIIVVESALRGGSIITAEYANEFSKDVFAVPGNIGNKKSAGCNKLIKTHKAHLLDSVEDIVYISRWESTAKQTELNFTSLTEVEQKVCKVLDSSQAMDIDFIHGQSGISFSELSSILLNLELKGFISSKPGKKYILL